jgi:GTP-binding protein
VLPFLPWLLCHRSMFYDELNVSLKAGNGGDGCFSFRRAKYEPRGGPNGGNGGNGGNVYIVADNNVSDLTDYKFQPLRRAKNGEPGRGSDQHGAKGDDLVLPLPVGTVVVDRDSGEVVAEALEIGKQVLLLQGGVGGKGNAEFKSSTNQAPRQYTLGTPGGEGDFRLLIKTIADIGLVGFPNAGKSTLLSMLTNANPKTAAYPFTTLFPTVGILDYKEPYARISIADIPGLIEGASENRGLGHRFLKHIERCKVLLFIVDMQATDGRDPTEDYQTLRGELERYQPELLSKPHLVAANKMDEPDAAKHLKALKKVVNTTIFPISCVSEDGFDALKKALLEAVVLAREIETSQANEDSALADG